MNARRMFVTGAIVVAFFSALLSGALASNSTNAGAAEAPSAIGADDYELSAPVRDLEATGSDPSVSTPRRVNPLGGEPARELAASKQRDPLAADGLNRSGRTPATGLVFDGTSNPTGCGGCSPPDTTGDVGPNHYIQMVNATKVAIYDKSGNLLEPPFNLGDLYTAGPCTDDLGDPQVLYDPLADRWLLSQFTATNQLCFAISQTRNPRGAYHLYSFITPEFPDYFKVGVWPSGYYVSSNESTYVAYAFDREKMLAGDPTASGVRVPGETNFLLPADVDGAAAPPANSGGLFYTFKDDDFHGGADRIEVFRFNANFDVPASSSFQLIKTIPITPFEYTVCGFFNLDCIPQAGTAQKVDAVSEWPMQRFAYRRFAGHETLVGNFAVGGGSAVPGSAIRWFEMRNSGSGWNLFQEGTEDEGGSLNRFMGSIAMDREGNIALGYSASSSTTAPSIHYATRAKGDPAGTLQAERVMQAGGGSQTGSNRWGDYSAMSVDPVDDCTFWYTNEYYNPSSATGWKTAIGTFKMPGCPSNKFKITKVKRNKKKGTAKMSVKVPGPGTLKLSGRGVKRQRGAPQAAERAGKAKQVAGAGTVKLKIKAKGKKSRQLNRKGKTKVKAKVTYKPTGGTAASKTRVVRLKKK